MPLYGIALSLRTINSSRKICYVRYRKMATSHLVRKSYPIDSQKYMLSRIDFKMKKRPYSYYVKKLLNEIMQAAKSGIQLLEISLLKTLAATFLFSISKPPYLIYNKTIEILYNALQLHVKTFL